MSDSSSNKINVQHIDYADPSPSSSNHGAHQLDNEKNSADHHMNNMASDMRKDSATPDYSTAIVCTTEHLGKPIFLHRRGSTQGPAYAEHGPLVDHHIPQDNAIPASPELAWSRIRRFMREPFAEFFGVFILILFGDGVVAQVVLSKGANGNYQSISWGWGLGVMLGVYTGGISGAHLNPAVTFANCVYRKFPWRKFPIYLVAQTLGALCASLVVYANYKSAIDAYEGGPNIRTVPGFSNHSTAGIFCTYPAAFMSRTGQFFSEFIASTLLMFLIYALKDDGNLGAGNLTPLGLFFIIFGIGCAWGWETGYAINLARDFGPRLASYMLGYGHEVWSAGNYYFWVPMVAPFFGCLFGGWLYDVFLFTGESPINAPWMGLERVFRPTRAKWSSTEQARLDELNGNGV